MKTRNKKIYVTILILFIMILYSTITICINNSRIKTGQEPKYCLKTINKEGNKITYWGLGYKVIRYLEACPKEPFTDNIGVKMGSWFMKYKLSNKKEEKKIKTLDDFYSIEETLDNDIRKLPSTYNSEDAQNDGCYITEKYNLDLYQKFMDDVRNKKTSVLRIANETSDGSIILIDVLYYKDNNKIYTVVDKTRTNSDEEYILKEFENIGNFEYNNNIYWVVYNDQISINNINTRNAYVLVKLTK